MQESSGHTTPGWGLRIASLVGVSLVYIGVCAGYTFAQSSQSDPASKAELQRKQAAAFDAGHTANVAPKPGRGSKRPGRPAALAKGKPQRTTQKKLPSVNRRGLAKGSMKTNPNAKWACDRQTVTLDPVWRGNQRLSFGFDIRNEGTEDLTIKAKGG